MTAMPTAMPMMTPFPSFGLLLEAAVEVVMPVEVCDAAVPVPVPVAVPLPDIDMYVTTDIWVVCPGVNVANDNTAEVCPEAGPCVTVTTTAEVPTVVSATTVWTAVDPGGFAVLTFVTMLVTLLMLAEDDVVAEPEPAAAFHFANVNAMDVPESPQFLDIVLYTLSTSLESFWPRHDAALSRNPPPLLHTQVLNLGTVDVSQAEASAAA